MSDEGRYDPEAMARQAQTFLDGMNPDELDEVMGVLARLLNDAHVMEPDAKKLAQMIRAFPDPENLNSADRVKFLIKMKQEAMKSKIKWQDRFGKRLALKLRPAPTKREKKKRVKADQRDALDLAAGRDDGVAAEHAKAAERLQKLIKQMPVLMKKTMRMDQDTLMAQTGVTPELLRKLMLMAAFMFVFKQQQEINKGFGDWAELQSEAYFGIEARNFIEQMYLTAYGLEAEPENTHWADSAMQMVEALSPEPAPAAAPEPAPAVDPTAGSAGEENGDRVPGHEAAPGAPVQSGAPTPFSTVPRPPGYPKDEDGA